MNHLKSRLMKRRGAKACAQCRLRKVRCDLIIAGVPCGNCKFSSAHCIIPPRKRTRKANASPEEDTSNIDWYAALGLHVKSDKSQVTPWHIKHQLEGSHIPHQIYREYCQKLAAISTSQSTPSGLSQQIYRLENTFLRYDGINTSRQMRGIPLRLPMQSNSMQTGLLPSYMQELPQNLSDDDLDYLKKKGAFEVPPIKLRNELLRSYIEYVHGYMPVLELHVFLEIVERDDGNTGRVSVLLFQAVMFAATAFVGMHHLRTAGFSTRKAARKAYYTKVRVLYDLDCERDTICIVQALLLMTYWCDLPEEEKNLWHWLGIAISLSTTLSSSRQRLWKRIMWSCFMRDRLIALAMGRPTRIKDDEFDVPVLTLEDFELEQVKDVIAYGKQECLLESDIEMMKQLAKMCIEKTKLCVCIGHVLTAQYSARESYPGEMGSQNRTISTTMLIAKVFDPDLCDIYRCDAERWRAELPDSIVFVAPSAVIFNEDRTPLRVHCAFLQLLYLATIGTLYRPQALHCASLSPSSELHDLYVVARQKVRLAASEITEICQKLYDSSLLCFLPMATVTVLTPAIMIHFLDMKSADEETRSMGIDMSYKSMRALHHLRESYTAADLAIRFLLLAIDKIEVQLNDTSSGSEIEKLLTNCDFVAPFVSSREINAETTEYRSPASLAEPQAEVSCENERKDQEASNTRGDYSRWSPGLDDLLCFEEGLRTFGSEDEMHSNSHELCQGLNW